MKVFVDTGGLAAAGAALAGGGSPNTPPQAEPGAADPVSQSLFAILGTRGLIVSGLLTHGSALRELGGMTVTGTATGFETTDADNALPFIGGGSPGPSAAPIAAMMPPTPEVPALPAMPVPPTMPGDAFAALVHAGPGGSALRQTAATLRGQVAAAIRNDADDVTRAGNRIDTSWDDDGNQRAGANTISHGGWLHGMADATHNLAGAFDTAADHLDNARQATPTPEEFQTARRNIAVAQAAHDPIAFSKATADYAQLNAGAAQAMYDYHGQATTTAAALDTPLQTAPPIAGGNGGASGPDDTIVGDPGRKYGGIQAVDNEGQNGSPPGQPAAPGGQPQIGPFPVPPQVAADAPPPPAPPNPPGAPPSLKDMLLPPGAAGPSALQPGLAPVTEGDVAIGAAGAVAGGTADGVRQTTLNLIDESPGTGPGKAPPGLLKWLEELNIGGVDVPGFSRVGGVVAGASAIPAVMSDIHDGNSVAEAVTREAAGTGAGLWAGGVAGGFLADVVAGGTIGSVIPGAGTAAGVVAGAVVGAAAALGVSKLVEWAW
jgi:hypothetical protein